MSDTIPPNRSTFWVIAGAAVMVMILIVLTVFMIQRHLTLRQVPVVSLSLSDEDAAAIMQNQERLHLGKMQFNLRCSDCHGFDAKGGRLGPDLTDDVWIYDGSLNGIINSIAQGAPMRGMPGWQDKLLPEDIRSLGAYVKSLSE